MTNGSSAKKDAGKPRVSAGILVYRKTAGDTEVLLGHPGGPFWKNKDAGSWTIPKGEPGAGEELHTAAMREFTEETGWTLPFRRPEPLGLVKQKAGKWIYAWGLEASRPAEELFSNEFEIEWPPRSGKKQRFPEIDRFAWFCIASAKEKINPAQTALLEELEKKLTAP